MTWFNLTVKQSSLLEQCVPVDGPGFQAGSSYMGGSGRKSTSTDWPVLQMRPLQGLLYWTDVKCKGTNTG